MHTTNRHQYQYHSSRRPRRRMNPTDVGRHPVSSLLLVVVAALTVFIIQDSIKPNLFEAALSGPHSFLPNVLGPNITNSRDFKRFWTMHGDGAPEQRLIFDRPSTSRDPPPRRLHIIRIHPHQESFDLISEWIKVDNLEILEHPLFFRYRADREAWIDEIHLDYQSATGIDQDSWNTHIIYSARPVEVAENKTTTVDTISSTEQPQTTTTNPNSSQDQSSTIRSIEQVSSSTPPETTNYPSTVASNETTTHSYTVVSDETTSAPVTVGPPKTTTAPSTESPPRTTTVRPRKTTTRPYTNETTTRPSTVTPNEPTTDPVTVGPPETTTASVTEGPPETTTAPATESPPDWMNQRAKRSYQVDEIIKPVKIKGLNSRDKFRFRVRHLIKDEVRQSEYYENSTEPLTLSISELSFGDVCALDNFCSHHGRCISLAADTGKCKCEKGYYGRHCQIPKPCEIQYDGKTGQELCEGIGAICVPDLPVLRCEWKDDIYYNCTKLFETDETSGEIRMLPALGTNEGELERYKEESHSRKRTVIILSVFLLALTLFSIVIIINMVSKLLESKKRLKRAECEVHELARRWVPRSSDGPSSSIGRPNPSRLKKPAGLSYNNQAFDVE